MSTQTAKAVAATDSVSYDDLYRRWENSPWKATAIDFSTDRAGWRALSDLQRRSGLWLYSMFFYGEDSVADNLSPYIDAAPTEEQAYFLTTQQVDEARHAVFFHRFFQEVIGVEGETLADTLATTDEHLNWGLRGVFGRLDRMAAELRKDRSLPKFAQAIALYHLIVEATLAQPGQHFIQDFFTKAGEMPGFLEGMDNVATDEQRHIGFGVKSLADAFRRSDECKAAVDEMLREVIPYALAVFVPPGFDRSYTREYGFEMEDIFAFGLGSIKAKWRATGYPLEERPPGVFPLDPTMDNDESARIVVALLEAGVMGAPNGRPDASPQTQERFFEIVARSFDASRVNGRPFMVQWRFSDADPWHVRVSDGTAHAAPGEAHGADVTVQTDWKTWCDMSVRNANPVAAVLRGKLRPQGSPRALFELSRMAGSRFGVR
jgi:ribonucleotide reductase beta subunit family protein with ferritin-like domain